MDVDGNYFPMRVFDIEVLGVDFSTTGALAANETIVTAQWTMHDDGLQKIGTENITGFIVSQQVQAAAIGRYYPTCTITTNLGNRITLPDPGRGMLQVV